MKEDLLKIINNYGVLSQLKQFNEESYELIEAIINAENNRLIGIIRKPCEKAIDHIAEEIADVLNMVEQFMYYYDIDIKDVVEIKHQKIDRTISRIEEGYYDK